MHGLTSVKTTKFYFFFKSNIILSAYNFNQQRNPTLYDHSEILTVTTIGFTYKIWKIILPYLYSCKTS
jgi:hypothetical protein